MRLDKLLADSGYGSRNDVKKLMKDKLVSVNGLIVTNPGYNTDEEHDVITGRLSATADMRTSC